MKFKIGDKVRILPSAMLTGVSETEIGKVVKITKMNFLDCIMISDSRGDTYGCWAVNYDDIAPVIVKGQQLLFDFMTP